MRGNNKKKLELLGTMILIGLLVACSSGENNNSSSSSTVEPSSAVVSSEPSVTTTNTNNLDSSLPESSAVEEKKIPDDSAILNHPDIQFNAEADTNKDGYISEIEWKVWTDAHPADTNKDLLITAEEQAAYDESQKPKEKPAESKPSTSNSSSSKPATPPTASSKPATSSSNATASSEEFNEITDKYVDPNTLSGLPSPDNPYPNGQPNTEKSASESYEDALKRTLEGDTSANSTSATFEGHLPNMEG